MVEPYLRRSPLAHLGLRARAASQTGVVAEAEVLLGERPHRCQINLRGNAADPAFLDAVRQATGLDLPQLPNSVARGNELRALWLGPNEWLVIGPAGRETDLVRSLRTSLLGQHAAVTDVSEARTCILVAGAKARELLARGISLDLHPRVFGPGRCGQTGMAGANIIIEQIDDRPGFEIAVLNSFADHLWRWLERAGEDYRIAVAGD
ncbi:sarcosine oxidase subunit gamma [Hypericibacter adhaerens]|uniref:Sarcosine oxidase subunit gamma n=1 Tax=Hypericibacter adhaerens TaxID=2602016 RepID=A0A5J6MWM1_9PROT|nr:sarcosine oxidase subunit gamma family protein [Hypericibacter adhaerens]QEX21671.1 sarcosine oxidase subunit gamma [Hypericibacter adhaerens]